MASSLSKWRHSEVAKEELKLPPILISNRKRSYQGSNISIRDLASESDSPSPRQQNIAISENLSEKPPSNDENNVIVDTKKNK
jgi:hypothetical protein